MIDFTFLNAMRVEVVDQDEREVGGKIRLRRAGAEERPAMAAMSVDPKRPGFVAAYPPVDALITKPGYVDVLLAGVDSDQRVVLQREERSKTNQAAAPPEARAVARMRVAGGRSQSPVEATPRAGSG